MGNAALTLTVLERLSALESFIVPMSRRFSSDPDLQQDLAQEMRVRVWEALISRRECNDSYLRQACVRRAQDYLKRGKSIDAHKRRKDRTPLEDSSARIDPDDSSSAIEFAQRLQKTLIGSARDVAILLGRGKRPAEIAVGHGVSRQMIGHRVVQIRDAAVALDQAVSGRTKVAV